MHRVVVVQWSRLGDLLQTRPLLNHILRNVPDVHITLCADSRYASVIAAMPEDPEFWPIDLARLSALAKHRSSHVEALKYLGEICAGISDGETDKVYVLSRSSAAAVFAGLLHPNRSFGYSRNKDSVVTPAIIDRLEFAMRENQRVSIQLADLWTCLDGERRDPQWPLPLKDARVPGRTPSSHGRQIGLLCDAGEVHRSIPAEWLIHVVGGITVDHNARVTLFGASTPAGGNDPLRAAAAKTASIADARGKLTLTQFMTCLAEQDVVIGPDTGGLHLAAACGVPVVGLYFGGASCLNTGPFTPESVVIQEPRWDVETADVVVALAQSTAAGIVEHGLPSSGSLHKSRLDAFGLCYASFQWTTEECKRVETDRKSFYARICPQRGQPAEQEDSRQNAVSIIIPEHGQSHYTDDLLRDLTNAFADIDGEVIVVGGGQQADRSGSICEDAVRRVHSSAPLSFAQACNLGASRALHNRLLFLNNDTRVTKEDLGQFLRSASANDISSPVLRYPDGLLQNCGVSLQGGRIMEIGHGCNHSVNLPAEPDALSAVAMMVSKSSFDMLGGFDESFVNGYEDLDFCLRAKQKGIGCAIVHSSFVTHFRGSTEKRFAHEEPNWIRFRERWKHVLDKPPACTRQQPRSPAPLLMLSPEPACAAGSSLRWVWPLRDMNLKPGRDFNWLTESEALKEPETLDKLLCAAEGIIVFRPLESEWIQWRVLAAMRDSHAALLVDSDDLLIGRFPMSSPRGQARRDYEQRFRELLSRATIITASSEHLTEALSAQGYRTECVPCVPHRKQQSSARPSRHATGKFCIGFFGTLSHLLDLGSILPALAEILREFAHVQFYWWGCRPGELAFHPQVRQGGPVVEDYETHLSRLHTFDLDMAVVPLLDTPAARVKTPVKCYEYALAGVPAVYSAVPPYSEIVDDGRTGLLAKETTASWVSAIRSLIEDSALCVRIADEARRDTEARIVNAAVNDNYRTLLNRVAPSFTATIKGEAQMKEIVGRV